MAPAETQRSWLTTAFDRYTSKKAGLPPEQCHYTVSPVRIPITDNHETFDLVGDLYRPVLTDPASKSRGTILAQGPYGRGIEMTAPFARPYAARGYHVLFVSCRGTSGSGGTWQPFRTEARDGQAVVAWMRQQPWYAGRFATVGFSFLAYTQLALLRDPPADMVAAVLEVGPHDVGDFCWGAGAMQLDLVVWSEAVRGQGRPSAYDVLGPLHRAWGMLGAARRLRPVLDAVPFRDAVKRHFGGDAPWVHDWIAHEDPADAYYAPMRHTQALDGARIPVLITAGWHDIFLPQCLEQYRRLRAHNDKVCLVVGPWAHTQVEGTMIDTFSWIETHLAGRTVQQKQWESGVTARVFITGLNEWRLLPVWPPPDTKAMAFYFHPDRTLSSDVSTPNSEGGDAEPPSFIFSPTSPTPSIGGPFLGLGAGIKDDTALASRADVLSFTTAPLAAPLQVLGAPHVVLSHEADSRHADLFVRISEVDGKGRSRNVTEGYKRLDPKREWKKGQVEQVEVVLRECAHVFRAGTRMRVYVAGGSSRVWLRNPGTDGGVDAKEMKDVRHWVHTGRGGGSRVVVRVGELQGNC